MMARAQKAPETMPRGVKARVDGPVPVWRKLWKPDARRPRLKEMFPIWVRGLKDRPGVYMIRDERTHAVLYVGQSETCLLNALRRHFFAWGEDARGPHHRAFFRKETVEVKVYLVRSEWARATEADLIAKYKPTANVRQEARNCTTKAPTRTHGTTTWRGRQPGDDSDEIARGTDVYEGDDVDKGIPF